MGALELVRGKGSQEIWKGKEFEHLQELAKSLLPTLSERAGRLYHNVKPQGFYVEAERRAETLLLARTAPTGGHLQLAGTMSRLVGVWWPTMEAEVARLVDLCGICLAYRVKRAVAEAVRPWAVAGMGERCHVDLIPMATAETGEQFIIQMIDAATRFVMSGALSQKTAQLGTWNNWIRVFALPKLMVSDPGREFDNNLMRELCDLAGLEWHYTTPENPQTNGVAEKAHHLYGDMVKMALGGRVELSPKVLSACDLAMNTHVHTATGTTAYALVFGRKPVMPFHVAAGVIAKAKTAAAEWMHMLALARQEASK